MPRGKKTCPKCNAEHGPRTHKCGCGYEFFKAAPAVDASPDAMTTDHKQIISDLKSTVTNIESKNRTPVASPPVLDRRTTVAASTPPSIQAPQVSYRAAGRSIYTPAGPCPAKPAGFKNDKWEEPWTEDTVRDWASEVYNSGPPYLPEAVVYFARFFWDINGPDYKKVRSLILETLVPKKSYEPDESDEELVTN